MPWPPEEKDLEPEKVKSFIPDLLDTFCTVLVSRQPLDHDKSKSNRTIRLKNSLSQDIVYAASNGAIRFPKSVLFPAVVKAICNNTEIVKLINKYGHGISYNLVKDIETEFALKVINKQALNGVLIPDKCIGKESPPVALMIADNIDNLKCTVTGAGTSHRVNSILVLKQKVKGKHYNRVVILHSRLLLDDFEVSLSERNSEMLNSQKTLLSQLKLNICQDEFERVQASKEIRDWETRFETYVFHMRKNGTDLVKFWMSYLDISDV